ncbi:hypothetical protein CM15mP43_08240 [bacterium]|nr:MAG: hypothetical protein CM15mP43_08240 [bacterium]
MTRSMTGYSSKTITIKNVSLYLQIKSENSKGLDINYNDEFNDFELNDLVKKKIESKFNRGKIRINFSIDIVNNSNQIKVLNTEINKYLELIKSEKINLNITYGDIIKFIEIDKNKLLKKPYIRSKFFMLLQSCILDLIKKQKAEGKLTLKSINSKLLKIDLIKQNIRSKFAKYSKKLEKKYISELKKTSDSSYLKKEISPLIEKIDIEEEIVRLDSHIKTIFKLMRKNNNNLGLIMDFYMQEVNREANTLASKSKDASLSNDSIKIKHLVNQIRELASNLE